MQPIANNGNWHYVSATSVSAGLACVFLILGSLFGGGSNLPLASAATDTDTHAYLYIFGNQGEFAKLDLQSLQVTAKGNLAQIDRLRDVVAPYVPVTAAHAFGSWQPGNMLYDNGTKRLFAVLPAKISEDDSPSEYSIVILRMPDFEFIGRIAFPDQLPGAIPSIALSPDGRTLFINYLVEQGPNETSLLDIYNAADLKKTLSMHDTVPTTQLITGSCFKESMGSCFNNTFGLNAYASADGKTIFDWDIILSKLTVTGTQVTRELLGTKYAGPVVGGKSLVIEKDPSTGERFASVYDFEVNKQIGSKVHVRPVGNLFLTPDGKKIVLVGSRIVQEQTAPDRESGVGYLTGEVVIYSVADGSEIRTLNFSAFAGKMNDHRVICVSPAGEHMIFQGGKAALFDVQLAGSYEARPLPIRMNIGDSPKCVFTTEPAKSTN